MEATTVGSGAGARSHDGCHAVLNAAVVVVVLMVALGPAAVGEVVVVLAVASLAVVALGLLGVADAEAVCSSMPPRGAQDHLRVPLLQSA